MVLQVKAQLFEFLTTQKEQKNFLAVLKKEILKTAKECNIDVPVNEEYPMFSSNGFMLPYNYDVSLKSMDDFKKKVGGTVRVKGYSIVVEYDNDMASA